MIKAYADSADETPEQDGAVVFIAITRHTTRGGRPYYRLSRGPFRCNGDPHGQRLYGWLGTTNDVALHADGKARILGGPFTDDDGLRPGQPYYLVRRVSDLRPGTYGDMEQD